ELAGGLLLPAPYFAVVPAPLDAAGELAVDVPGGLKTVGGAMMHCQVASASSSLPFGWDLSNMVRLRFYDDPISSRAIRDATGYKLAVHEKKKQAGTSVTRTLHALAVDPRETTDLLSTGAQLTPEQTAALADLQAALDALLATGPQGGP